jgi:hypothetical protein
VSAGGIRFLVKHLKMATTDVVLALCAEVFPAEEVPARCPRGRAWFWKTFSATWPCFVRVQAVGSDDERTP